MASGIISKAIGRGAACGVDKDVASAPSASAPAQWQKGAAVNEAHHRDHQAIQARRSPTGAHRARGERHDGHGSQRRSEEHTSELQSHLNLVCRLLLEKKKHM